MRCASVYVPVPQAPGNSGCARIQEQFVATIKGLLQVPVQRAVDLVVNVPQVLEGGNSADALE